MNVICFVACAFQPSSAAAEQIYYSLLSNSFKENQQNALEDYISTSVMLQCNSK